jgi:hypothetical protein
MKHLWNNQVGNVAQIGGIETSVLDNGPARGSRIAWFNTGTGLRYKVAIDRSLDIVDAFYNQHGLAFISHGGLTVPRPDAHSGIEWLRSFAGGLLTTCGLTHIGGPESDDKESRGLHGRISNLPAEIESVIQPNPAKGQMDMSITGVVRESQLFGTRLELRRTITSTLGSSVIEVHDQVTNRGNMPCPHMILYHCNFGWPLVDGGVDIIYQGDCMSRGFDFDNAIFNEKRNYKKCCKPLESHRGYGEACGFINVKADKKGMCQVGLVNRKLPLALMLRYPKKQLPYLANWQHFGPGEYVCGLEPGTNPPIGQNKAREQKKLIMLQPGETRKYHIEMEVLAEPKIIRNFVKVSG